MLLPKLQLKQSNESLPERQSQQQQQQHSLGLSNDVILKIRWSSESAIETLVKEIHMIHKQISIVWHKFQQLFLVNSTAILKLYRRTYNRQNKKLWEDFICVRNYPNLPQQSIFFDTALMDSNRQRAREIREAALTQAPSIYNAVKDIRILPDKMLNPVIFQSIYSIDASRVPPEQRDRRVFRKHDFHLFVFVHGFQGNSFDMRLIKNHMMLLYPECLFLLSTANEGRTEGNIAEMGSDLAKEIHTYVRKWCPGTQLGKISFIVHSLGGVIARAALVHLKDAF